MLRLKKDMAETRQSIFDDYKLYQRLIKIAEGGGTPPYRHLFFRQIKFEFSDNVFNKLQIF